MQASGHKIHTIRKLECWVGHFKGRYRMGSDGAL